LYKACCYCICGRCVGRGQNNFGKKLVGIEKRPTFATPIETGEDLKGAGKRKSGEVGARREKDFEKKRMVLKKKKT